MNGTDLKLELVRANVKAKDVASAMGISASRLSRILAAEAQPREETVRRFLDAVNTCRTSGTRAVA